LFGKVVRAKRPRIVFVGSIGDLVFLKGDWVRGRREQGLETGVLEEHDSVRLGYERFELGLLTLQRGGGRVKAH
jgi:hypothetical protein